MNTQFDYVLNLITYDEMYLILKEKFNVTHQELRYWIKQSVDKAYDDKNVAEEYIENFLGLMPFKSDLPFINYYATPDDEFFNEFFFPELHFYEKKSVLNFSPLPPLRFVYRKDLTGKRNWNDYRSTTKDSLCSQILLKANECGILRFYDHSINDFTFFPTETQKWCQTFEGEAYVDNPESFFLLYDILNVERIFLGKKKEFCLEELGLKSQDIPHNVIEFKKIRRQNERATQKEEN